MGNVPDALGLCRAVLDESLDRMSGILRAADYEDAVSHLHVELCLAWVRYNPGLGVPFLAYATGKLRYGVVNWYREQHGRGNARKPLADALPLERPSADDEDDQSDDFDGERQLGLADTEGAGAPPDAGAAALSRALNARDRETVAAARDLGLRADPGAETRARTYRRAAA